MFGFILDLLFGGRVEFEVLCEASSASPITPKKWVIRKTVRLRFAPQEREYISVCGLEERLVVKISHSVYTYHVYAHRIHRQDVRVRLGKSILPCDSDTLIEFHGWKRFECT